MSVSFHRHLMFGGCDYQSRTSFPRSTDRMTVPDSYKKTPPGVFSTSSKFDTMTMLLGRPRLGQWSDWSMPEKGTSFPFS
jgi:hypothetical protein